MAAVINPESLHKPKGYSHGLKAEGQLVSIALQLPYDKDQQVVGAGFLVEDFAKQFEQALSNFLAVLKEAGGTAQNVVKLNIYITSKTSYWNQEAEVEQIYRKLMGEHNPPRSMMEIKGLMEDRALVAIDGMAVV